MMRAVAVLAVMLALVGTSSTASAQEQAEISLSKFAPEHYRYSRAELCVNCHQTANDVMTRAVGVDISSGSPELDGRGWLASIHANSQSHGDRVNTTCARCHAPTTDRVTRDSAAAAPITKGTWEGVTCGACHPAGLSETDSLTESLVTNLQPGSDPTDPASYVFIDRSDGTQLNAQCRYCHHESHDLLVPSKADMLAAGELRCIDCHMSGYAVTESGIVERFHNMKVEPNLPQSCSGELGTNAGCHDNASVEQLRSAIPAVKGPRKEW